MTVWLSLQWAFLVLCFWFTHLNYIFWSTEFANVVVFSSHRWLGSTKSKPSTFLVNSHGLLYRGLLKILESTWKYLIFYYPVPHMVCRTTFMKQGVWLLLVPKTMVDTKIDGLPPLIWWIYFFISGYKEIALLNNLMLSFS